MDVIAYIGLGANLGDPATQLRAAAGLIGGLQDTRVTAFSSLYRTSPVGNEDQPDFLNAVLEVRTLLSAKQLLARLLDIEEKIGRTREAGVIKGPRLIDCDLLLYGDLVRSEPKLQLPHPEMKYRLFVLKPLQEIASGLRLPGEDTIERLCLRCEQSGQQAVIIESF